MAVVISEDADYEGVRVTFRAWLENARITIQIDLGFGDVVYPAPEVTEYPTILGHDRPRMRGYPRETTVAEKFEAMIKLGMLNAAAALRSAKVMLAVSSSLRRRLESCPGALVGPPCCELRSPGDWRTLRPWDHPAATTDRRANPDLHPHCEPRSARAPKTSSPTI